MTTTARIFPAKLEAPLNVFSQEEAADAYERWGCNCGPSALAMMLSLKPDEVHSSIPGFDEKHYTSPTMMRDALRSLVPHRWTKFYIKEKEFANYGLNRIQWDGPWCNPGVPPAAAYRHTHWVGSMTYVKCRYIFDVNGGWMRETDWIEKLVPEILTYVKRSNGNWWITDRVELYPIAVSPS